MCWTLVATEIKQKILRHPMGRCPKNTLTFTGGSISIRVDCSSKIFLSRSNTCLASFLVTTHGLFLASRGLRFTNSVKRSIIESMLIGCKGVSSGRVIRADCKALNGGDRLLRFWCTSPI
uniref:Uncharacterized protein n=1 Tax=Romanomermis culicivorax TaxID=13658 RepID=A0A915I3R0_ROMCU